MLPAASPFPYCPSIVSITIAPEICKFREITKRYSVANWEIRGMDVSSIQSDGKSPSALMGRDIPFP